MRLSNLMDERSDEDRLEVLFERSFLRDTREDFEDECKDAPGRKNNKLPVESLKDMDSPLTTSSS